MGVVGGLAISLVVVTLFVSCEEGVYLGGPGCLPTDCARRCSLAGRSGGECVGDMCLCVGSPPVDAGADADVDGSVDAGRDGDAEHDDDAPDRAFDVSWDEGFDETEVREVICELPDLRDADDCCLPDPGDTCCGPDYYPDDDSSTKTCCDPVVCFLTCGGTCVAGGGCLCADSPVPAP